MDVIFVANILLALLNLIQVGTAEMPCKVAASLLQACYLEIIRLISGCVHIACFGLMITSLLQVELSRLFIHKLNACCFNKLQEVCKYQVASRLFFTDIMQLDNKFA